MSRVLRMGAIPAEVSPKARVEKVEIMVVRYCRDERVALGRGGYAPCSDSTSLEPTRQTL